MALPAAYRYVVWREEWGLYMGGSEVIGARVVDGGIVDVFPLDLLLDSDPIVIHAMGREHEFKYEADMRPMIGFLIDDDLEVPDAPPPPHTESSGIVAAVTSFGPVKYLSGMLDTALSAGYHTIQEAFPDLVCPLPAQGYDTMELAMTAERLEALIAAGEAATDKFLDTVWPLTRKTRSPLRRIGI